MSTTISSTEAVRHLGEYLERVRHRAETFILTKNEKPVAQLSPVSHIRSGKWKDLVVALKRLPHDRGFADDLAKVNQADQPAENPWA